MKLLEKPKFTTAHSRAGTKRALLGCAGHLLGGFVLSGRGGSRRVQPLCGGTGGGVRAAGFSLFRPGCRVGIYDLWYRHGSCAVLCGGADRLGRRAGNGCLSPRRDARLPMALSCLAVGLTGAVLQLRLAAARQIMRWCWARAFWPVAADISSSAQSTAIIAVCGARLRLPATWYACSLVVRCC